MKKIALVLLILVLMGACAYQEYRGTVTKVEFIKGDTKSSRWEITFSGGQEFSILTERIDGFIKVGDEVMIYRCDFLYSARRRAKIIKTIKGKE